VVTLGWGVRAFCTGKLRKKKKTGRDGRNGKRISNNKEGVGKEGYKGSGVLKGGTTNQCVFGGRRQKKKKGQGGSAGAKSVKKGTNENPM